MKTNVIETEVHTNTTESSLFKIKNNAKAFRLLIDGLYSNKIQSVTREIWSNALDSHIQAGKADVPFEVSFPSIFDTTFRVKDFGIGLSHTQVVNLYTTLFESTKEDSNDYVGKYGIGSKSPFAYTDSFSVTAVKDGEKNYYTAMMNKYGIPEIHHLHSEIVDEPNGVEVSFPVKKQDVNAFQTAAKRVSLGFDVKPKIDKGEDYEWPETYSDILTNGIYVKMGCVLYSVDEELIIDYVREHDYKTSIKNFSSFVRKMTNGVTVFEVEMGSVEILPSREGLQYGPNDPTIETLLKHFENFYDTLIPKINSILAKAPSAYRAVALFRAYQISSYITFLNKKWNCMITNDDFDFLNNWREIINDVSELHWRGDYDIFKLMNQHFNSGSGSYSQNKVNVLGYYHTKDSIQISKHSREYIKTISFDTASTSKLGSLSENIGFGIGPYGRNIYIIGDVSNRNPHFSNVKRNVVNKLDRYRENAIKKINEIKVNCEFNNSYSRHNDVVTYIQFDDNSSDYLKQEFFNKLDMFDSSVDYEIIFIDEYELSDEAKEKEKRVRKQGIDRLVNKVGYIFSKIYKDSFEYLKKASDGSVYTPYLNTVLSDMLIDSETKALLIPYSKNTDANSFTMDMRTYGERYYSEKMHNCFSDIMSKFDLDCVILVSKSNMPYFKEFFENHVLFEDLDTTVLDSMYESAKDNIIEGKKMNVDVYKPSPKYTFNKYEEDWKPLLPRFEEGSLYKDYMKFSLDTELKICHTCDTKKYESDCFLVYNLLPLISQDKYNNIYAEIESNVYTNDFQDYETKFKNLEEGVAKKYPFITFCHEHMGYYKLREQEVVDYLIDYINDIDKKEVTV